MNFDLQSQIQFSDRAGALRGVALGFFDIHPVAKYQKIEGGPLLRH